MSSGPDMAYGSDELRAGGGAAVRTGEVAGAAERAVGAVAVAGGALGTVRGAAELVAAVARARDAHSGTCRSVVLCHSDLDGRAQAVAAMGDRLEVDTAAIAAGASP